MKTLGGSVQMTLRVFLLLVRCFDHFYTSMCSDSCMIMNGVNQTDSYLPGRVIQTIHPCGIQQCIKLCKGKTDCFYVNYGRKELVCELMAPPMDTGKLETKEDFYFQPVEFRSVCADLKCFVHSDCYKSSIGSAICLRKCSHHNYEKLIGLPICIRIEYTTMSYENAESSCRAEGSELAILDTETKFNAYRASTAYIAVNGDVYGIWVAAKRVGEFWKWRHGTTAPITVWSPFNGPGDCAQSTFQKIKAFRCTGPALSVCQEN